MKARRFQTAVAASLVKDDTQTFTLGTGTLGVEPVFARIELIGATADGVERADWKRSVAYVVNTANADKGMAMAEYAEDNVSTTVCFRNQFDNALVELHNSASSGAGAEARGTISSWGNDSVTVKWDEVTAVQYFIEITFFYECEAYFHRYTGTGATPGTTTITPGFNDWDLAFAVTSRSTEGILSGTVQNVEGVATYNGSTLSQVCTSEQIQTNDTVTSRTRGSVYNDSFLSIPNETQRLILSSPTSTGVDVELETGDQWYGNAGIVLVKTGGDSLSLQLSTITTSTPQTIITGFESDTLMCWAGDEDTQNTFNVDMNSRSVGIYANSSYACSSYLFREGITLGVTEASSEYKSSQIYSLKVEGDYSEASLAITSTGFTLTKGTTPTSTHWLVSLAHKEAAAATEINVPAIDMDADSDVTSPTIYRDRRVVVDPLLVDHIPIAGGSDIVATVSAIRDVDVSVSEITADSDVVAKFSLPALDITADSDITSPTIYRDRIIPVDEIPADSDVVSGFIRERVLDAAELVIADAATVEVTTVVEKAFVPDSIVADSDVAVSVSTVVEIPAGIEAFEKTGGALDYMGVAVTRVLPTQKLWAPGTLPQEYPGGWVTPGDYTLTLNTARIHDKEGMLSGVARAGNVIYGKVVSRGHLDRGWVNHAFDTAPDAVMASFTEGETITLAAGDVLHVGYFDPADANDQSGSDGQVIYCVASAPEWRGGLWGTAGTTAPSFDTDLWALLSARAAEGIVESGPGTIGGYTSTFPLPADSDYAETVETSPNPPIQRQAQRLASWLSKFAHDKITSPGSWTAANETRLRRTFDFVCNNVQHCFHWDDNTAENYYCGHGNQYYPPYTANNLFTLVLAASVLDGIDPSHEPFYRALSFLAQRVDMTAHHIGGYNYGNTGLPLADTDDYTAWIIANGGSDMGAFGDHRPWPWGIGVVASRLLGWADTQAMTDAFTTVGWADGDSSSSITQHGGGWNEDGLGPCYSHTYAKMAIRGIMALDFAGIEADSILLRYAKRNFMYMDRTSSLNAESNYPQFYTRWSRNRFVAEPRNPVATVVNSGLNVSWDAVAETDLSRYRIYRQADGGGYTVIDDTTTGTNYTDTSVTDGVTYDYRVSAVDNTLNESTLSDIVTILAPVSGMTVPEITADSVVTVVSISLLSDIPVTVAEIAPSDSVVATLVVETPVAGLAEVPSDSDVTARITLETAAYNEVLIKSPWITADSTMDMTGFEMDRELVIPSLVADADVSLTAIYMVNKIPTAAGGSGYIDAVSAVSATVRRESTRLVIAELVADATVGVSVGSELGEDCGFIDGHCEKTCLIEVYNVALSRLSLEPIADLDEGTPQARKLKVIWPMIRRRFLVDHSWNGAKITETLTEIPDLIPTSRWDHVYDLPNCCLRVLRVNGVENAGGTDKWEVELRPDTRRSRALFTDADECVIEYMTDIENIKVLAPMTLHALSLELAVELASQFGKSTNELNALKLDRDNALRDAKAIDGQEEFPQQFLDGSLIDVRY